MADFIYPKGGWGRAFEYVKHRVRRLPDTPEKIGRGVFAGVFAAFTPFYGLHFFIAAGLAMIMRGNVLASLMATFFGNPLTYIPIAVAALGTGYWMLGIPFNPAAIGIGAKPDPHFCGLGCQFGNAFADLWHNFTAIFTQEEVDWSGLSVFYDEVFFPYMIGGIVPGIVSATVCYYVTVPLISAYQNRRRKKLREKLDQLKKNPLSGDGDGPKTG